MAGLVGGRNVNNTVNNLVNARSVFLIFRVQAGTFNRKEVFKRERHLFS